MKIIKIKNKYLKIHEKHKKSNGIKVKEDHKESRENEEYWKAKTNI